MATKNTVYTRKPTRSASDTNCLVDGLTPTATILVIDMGHVKSEVRLCARHAREAQEALTAALDEYDTYRDVADG